MNYIKKLKQDNEQLAQELQNVLQGLDEFKAHLNLDKYSGVDINGDRKDWISTTDVIRWINYIQSAI